MTDNKESQIDEIERDAAIALRDGNMVQADEIVLDGLDCHLFLKGGEIYEMRRDLERSEWNLKSALDQLEKLQQAHDDCSQNLEAARQANTEISKHNQELSKENERTRRLIDEFQQEVQIRHKDYDPIALDKRIVKLKEQLKLVSE